MNRPTTCWRRRSGVTLIEVLAALALLGSLAVAMVLSRGRLGEQYGLAEKKREAVQVADAMLARWWAAEPKRVPAGVSGRVEGHPGWVWETEVVPNKGLTAFDARVVRLRIMDETALGDPVELTSVDVVLPRFNSAAASGPGPVPGIPGIPGGEGGI